MDEPQYLVGEELLTSVAMEIGHTGREDLQEKLIAILNAGPVEPLDMSVLALEKAYGEYANGDYLEPANFHGWYACWCYLREQMKGKV